MFPASTLQYARRLVPGTRGAFAWIIVHHSRSLCVPPMELHTITCVCSSEKCVISRQTSLPIIQEINFACETLYLNWRISVTGMFLKLIFKLCFSNKKDLHYKRAQYGINNLTVE